MFSIHRYPDKSLSIAIGGLISGCLVDIINFIIFEAVCRIQQFLWLFNISVKCLSALIATPVKILSTLMTVNPSN